MMPTCKDFKKIVVEEIPLIDVRAPIEFEKGAFLTSVNLPLMEDSERHLVGICYKEKGNDEAVKLGHRLVSGAIREERIQKWKAFIAQNKDCMLYCFRGGLRSEISQQWMIEAIGSEIQRLEGGYKAFRNYLMASLEPEQIQSKPILLGGCTGSGKTILLKKIGNAIDLEGLANHRGSSFGRNILPQPTQINFENNLAYQLIQHQNKGFKEIILEDEGANIGKCLLPKPLAHYFSEGALVVLEASMEERIENTLKEYVVFSQQQYEKAHEKEQGILEWATYIRESLSRIKNRLGGERQKQVGDLFEQALVEQQLMGNFERHKDWIEMLLRDYYDPMYQYQLQKVRDRIIYTGNMQEVTGFLKDQYSSKADC